MRAGNLSEAHEHFIKEKSQPDAFAFALFAHQIHAVVPVTGAHERQAVLTEFETVQDGPDTVIVKTCRLFGAAGQIVIGIFIRVHRTACNEGNGLIQHAGVPGGEDIAAGC